MMRERHVKTKHIIIAATAAVALGTTALVAQGQEADPPMTFFVTSTDQNGNFGGLAGADALCQRLAQAAGAGDNTWHAYLSTQGEGAVNARDRIGTGPWHSHNGERIASNVAELHGDIERDRNYLYKGSALDENGNMVNGRGDQPNKHDILTGSNSLGYAYPAGNDMTCSNWTNGGADGSARLGHHDRNGGGTTSWNSAHNSRNCTLEGFNGTGGAGKIYCFAID